MKFINGGRPTPREEIETEVLPAFLGYYERFEGYGFWAAVEKSTNRFVGWFHFRPAKGAPARRDRARLPAAQGGLGKGLCGRKAHAP